MISILVARLDDFTLPEPELLALDNDNDLILLEVVADLPKVRQALATIRPDILLLDGRLVDRWVQADLEVECQRCRNVKVLVVCRGGDDSFAARCLQCGARGLYRMGEDPHALVKAIRGVHSGDWWFSRRLLGDRLEALLTQLDADRQTEVLHTELTDADVTDRERSVINAAARGLTNKEIAKELGISEKTVKTHLSHVFQKLHIHRRIDLVRIEMQ
jgi:DNA-binding NarL/FixJ family response regulator